METSSGGNTQADPESNDLCCSFMKTVLASVQSYTHSLLPTQDHREPPISKLSRCLKHNDTQISERLAEFCTRYEVTPKAETVTSHVLLGFYSYFLSVSPSLNFADERKSKIVFQEENYTFRGFILVSEQKLQQVPPLSVWQRGCNYIVTVEPLEEAVLEFTKLQALLFEEYLFNDLLQLFDFTHVLKGLDASMLFIPKFSKEGGQVLAMSSVLRWLMAVRIPLPPYLEVGCLH
jgi:hypothetical protein